MLDDTIEEWRAIERTQGHYEVSNLGRVRRAKPGAAGHIVNPYQGNHGYFVVNMSVNGKYVRDVVHRLVAEAFLGASPVAGLHVNHIDANKLNNRVENLEWVTPLENARHAIGLGLTPHRQRGEAAHSAKLTEADVRFIRTQAPSVTNETLAARFGVTAQTVRCARSGITWAHVVVTAPPKWQYRGETMRAAKLTEADVRFIRSGGGGLGLTTLARRLGVSPQSVWRVRHGMTWTHVN